MFEHIAKSILEISLLSVAAVFLVMIIRAVFGARLKTKIICVLWMLVLVRLMLPVTIDSPVQLGNTLGFNKSLYNQVEPGSDFTASTNSHTSSATDLIDKSDTQISNAEIIISNISQIQLITPTVNTAHVRVNPWHIALGIWFFGVIGFLTVNIYIMFAFKRKVRSCKTIKTPEMQRLVNSNKAKLGLSQTISVKECQYVSVPVVTGLKNPIILLPAGISETLDLGKLDKIILHELCHIKRNDLLKNYLWLVARSLHWFNPLIWFAYKAYLNDVENVCDEYVLKNLSTDEVYEYSEALVEMAKRSKKIYCAPVLVSFCKDKSKLRKRVMNMLNPQKKSKSISIIAMIMMVIIVIGCFTTACTSVEPQDVSTDPQTPIDQLDEEDPSTPAPDPESTPTSFRDGADKVISDYAINGNTNVKYNGTINNGGDLMLSYTGDDGMTEYLLFKSNLSLSSIYYTHNQSINTTIEITEDQAMEYVDNYVKKFWPEMTAVIKEIVVEKSAFIAEGVLINPDDQSKFNLRVIINGQGKLIHIIRMHKIDIDQKIAEGEAISIEEARELALDCLVENIHITNPENLKTISQKLDETHFYPEYVFQFEYRSDEPTLSNFDYNATVMIHPMQVAHSTPGWITEPIKGWLIEPIVDNLNIISVDTAEKTAKEFIGSKYSYDVNELQTTSQELIVRSAKLYYQFGFNNVEDLCVLLSIETGECEIN